MSKTLAIVGAGPVGLEAALAAIDHDYEVTVFERGEVGDAVRRWGHVRMFSPFGMNVSIRGTELLTKAGHALPEADAILTGREYVAAYLSPVAELLEERFRTNVEVASIGRAGLFKTELIGDESRRDWPFRLLLQKGGREWMEDFDCVFDCTGTSATPNSLGDGGIPAAGERLCQEYIHYGAPDVAARHRTLFGGRRTMVIGAGHSAATVIRELCALRKSTVIWVTRRRERPPCREVEEDPLSERAALVRDANKLSDSQAIDLRAGFTVLAMEKTGDGVRVTLTDEYGEREEVTVDRIVAAVGFRPDLALTRELQTQTCWATEGTYNLAAALLGENGGGDCLAAKSFGPESLCHPEPGYFALGMKSYGRSPEFLIRTGREQVESVLKWMKKGEGNGSGMTKPE